MTKKCLLFFSVFALLLTACSQEKGLQYISIYSNVETTEEANHESEDTLKIAIASVISPKESLSKYNMLVTYLEENLGKEIIVIQKQTYDEVIQLLKTGEVHAAFICSLSYVIGKKENYMEGLAAPQADGKNVYQSYIIVRKDSEIENLDDLADKRFAFMDPYSYSGKLAVLQMLWEAGYNPETFFSETFYTYSHDYSIEAVQNGVVDGAAVDSIIFDELIKRNIEYYNNLKVIETGPYAGTPPIVVSNKVSKNLKDNLKSLVLNLHNSQEGKEILDNIGIEKYVPIDEQLYKPIEEIIFLLGED